MPMKKKAVLSPAMKMFLLNIMAFIPYLLYVGFVIANNQGPVDYETFMEIGSRIPLGKEIFVGNSYYPAAYVYVYTLLYLLPRPMSMAIWLLVPVVLAWLTMGRKPWVLLFGPLFANFLGGQSAVFAMLGMWGYNRNRELHKWSGGLWLGLITFKPHLVVFPVLFAAREWLVSYKANWKIPKQALGFLFTVIGWYLVGVPFGWDWPVQWLVNPRPESYRPQAGILPRSLVSLGVNLDSVYFWAGTLVLFVILMIIVWLANHKKMPLDLWMFCAACGFPFMHDYDLMQLIPFLDTHLRRRWALLASIPLWLVMLFAYGNDKLWFVVTFIPPILVAVALYENRTRTAPGIVSAS